MTLQSKLFPVLLFFTYSQHAVQDVTRDRCVAILRRVVISAVTST